MGYSSCRKVEYAFIKRLSSYHPFSMKSKSIPYDLKKIKKNSPSVFSFRLPDVLYQKVWQTLTIKTPFSLSPVRKNRCDT